MLTAQSQAMCKLMARLEILEQSTEKPSAVRSCGKVVSQSRPANRVSVVRTVCMRHVWGPHLKRECPLLVGSQNLMPNQTVLRNGGRLAIHY